MTLSLTSTASEFVDLDGLANLASVTSLLFLAGNPNLTTVQGLTSLEQVGNLVIQNHPNLAQCDIDALVAEIDVIGSTSYFNNTRTNPCM